MENTRKIPWRRITVESVAIILSILLAFGIDASWDAFKERKQEKAFLASLLNDFKEARTRIDASTDRHMEFIRSGQQLLEFYDGRVPAIDPKTLEGMLQTVFTDWTSLYLSSGSRDALFSSGDIDIISNEELRAMLAAWPSVVADAAEDDALIANDVMNNLAPYLHSKIRTRNVIRLSNSDAEELISPIESVNYDVLWKDRMFENLITFRIVNETFAVDENDRLIEAADEIIQVIESELDQ